ncbi:hypothetical protein [Tropicimonas marinistellae]|uniref:hypothetical protein n=1 Tax=Tropicimonas marinistellae TaxID=1739787 RepID=UPI00082C481E|nr:hypothetical protein [Tropicimonas marinistellae]
MALIADAFLIAGALGAALYCYVLSRRLARFTNLENGVGGAVAVLSVQVDEMTKALETARATSQASAEKLEQLTERAEAAAERIELLLASLHDIPEQGPTPGAQGKERVVRRTRRGNPEEART